MQRTASSIHYNKNTIHKRRSHTTLPHSLTPSFAACGKSSPEIVWVNRIYIITQFNILICPTNCFAPTTNTLICFYMVHGKCFSKYLLKKMTKKKKRTCERANWSILLLLFMHCSVFTARCSMLVLVVQCSVFCVTISGFLYSTDDYGIRRNLTLINLPDNDIVRFVSFGLATNFLFSLRLLWKTQERILIECAKIIISVGCEWRAYFIRIFVRIRWRQQIHFSDWQNTLDDRWHSLWCKPFCVPPFDQTKPPILNLHISQSHFNSGPV